MPITPDANGRWTAGTVSMGPEILDRMERAVIKVRERLFRATTSLNQANLRYAIVGGNAVASWVVTVDEGAVRNTRDVDILVHRSDLRSVTKALEQAGFVADQLADRVTFRDRESNEQREAIHLLFVGERTRTDHLLPAPEIEIFADPAGFPVLQLDRLVLMKLISNRRIDRVHVRDLISVGLIDSTWPARFPPELAERLQHLLDTPDG